jgi:hypothetical protein
MGEVEEEGIFMRWVLAVPDKGVGISGELPEPEEEEETEAERLRKGDGEEGLMVIGSECLAPLFWSIFPMFEKDID